MIIIINHLPSVLNANPSNIYELKLITKIGLEIIYLDGSKNLRLAYRGISVHDYPDIN
jgi:hypothetical protein